MADRIAFTVIVILILTGYAFWVYQLLKFADWIEKNLKSDNQKQKRMANKNMKELTRIITAQTTLIEQMPEHDANTIIASKTL